MSEFLGKDYELPKGDGGLYLKFEDGETKFRAISSAVVGWRYFNIDKKPVSLREKPEETPSDIGTFKDGSAQKVDHFWAFKVIDRSDNTVKVLQFTQYSVQKAILDLVNGGWADPKSYDLVVKKEGSGLKTEYSVNPLPPSDLSPEDVALVKNDDTDLEDAVFGQATDAPIPRSESRVAEESAQDLPKIDMGDVEPETKLSDVDGL